MTDEFAFDSPQPFDTAMITVSDWKELGQGRLRIGDGKDQIDVCIETAGTPFKLQPTELTADVPTPRQPTRLGIALSEPITEGRVTLTISAADETSSKLAAAD